LTKVHVYVKDRKFKPTSQVEPDKIPRYRTHHPVLPPSHHPLTTAHLRRTNSPDAVRALHYPGKPQTKGTQQPARRMGVRLKVMSDVRISIYRGEI